MNTFIGDSVRIHHNSDFSGKCTVVNISDNHESVEVLCSDLVDFVAEYIRAAAIAKLESLSSDEILGVASLQGKHD